MGVPKVLRIVVAILTMGLLGTVTFMILDLSSQEILSTKDQFVEAAQIKIKNSATTLQNYFGLEVYNGSETADSSLKQDLALAYTKPVLKFIGNLLPQLLMTLFFVVLWLAESVNFENVMNSTIFKKRFSSIKIFRRIEKDIIKFIRVKVLVSLGTGIGTGLACYFFDVSFPIFWGIFGFAINFIQMIGSFITVILCSIFAFVELESTSTLIFFVSSLAGIQVLFGSILEPVYMGKSFSLNIIVVLIMLMFWGFIWGVPGMIMSIPLTVFIKIVFEQFDRTKTIAKLME